jgi:hypothetical protein
MYLLQLPPPLVVVVVVVPLYFAFIVVLYQHLVSPLGLWVAALIIWLFPFLLFYSALLL